MQSERFFSALKGHGALCRLVLLPLESHGYQGRESVMHCLWEMDRWLQKFCVDAKITDPKLDVVNSDEQATIDVKQGGAEPEDDNQAELGLRGLSLFSSL